MTIHWTNLRIDDNICAVGVLYFPSQNIDDVFILKKATQSTWWKQRFLQESGAFSGFLLFFRFEFLYVFHVFHAA